LISAPLLAVVVGLLAGTRLPALRRLARHPLRWSVGLLGFQVSVVDVVATGGSHLLVVALTVVLTFVGTQALARALGFSSAQGLLVASGFSICGASAIAAMEPVADAEDGDSSLAVALVTVCGSLAIVVLPLLREPLGLDAHDFGVWVGASVHDVGQVAAAAGTVGAAALAPALVVKLSRVLLLAPMVLVQGRRSRSVAAGSPAVPWFVVAFVAGALVHSSGVLPSGALEGMRVLHQVLLLAGLVGLGAGIRPRELGGLRCRAVALGLGSWVLVACSSYALLRALG
jgi:uncharacterized integral membrane protein (TIGR00698 family)